MRHQPRPPHREAGNPEPNDDSEFQHETTIGVVWRAVVQDRHPRIPADVRILEKP
jgi:hypothetical protein